MIAATMSGVREQAKATEEEIHSTIEMLISLLRDREVVLINDVETIKHPRKRRNCSCRRMRLSSCWLGFVMVCCSVRP